MRVGRVRSVIAMAAVIVAACGSNASPSASTSSAPNEVPVVAADRFPPIRAAVPGSTPSPAPRPWRSTTDWRTYASNLFQYEISYPPTWAVNEGTPQFADEIDEGGLPWLFVRRGLADSSTLTVGEAVKGDIAIEQRDDHAELVSAHSITLAGGYEGMYLLYRGRIRLGPVTVQRIIVANGSVFYYFSFYGGPATEAADIGLFQQIYGTWKAT